jgi:serine/threonine-protein kinase
VGEVFAGRYELLDPIATGGMGTVWRVQDRQDGRLKAAKILRQSDAATLLRFVREQSMRIDHTHVVTPDSWAAVDDRVLFTMPLMHGGSLADLLAERILAGTPGLPPRWVALLLDQTLQALEAVHAAGIVHRDLKPGNLLLEPTDGGVPHLRLTDFGIAVPLDEPRMTRAAMTIGTPGYMPPEQWVGADPDPRSDLYAVGRVTYEMLVGTRPPSEEGAVPDLAAVRTGDPHHDAILDVVALATAVRIEERIPSAGAMREAVRSRGLLDLPPGPGDRIPVPERYASTLPFQAFPEPMTPGTAPTMAATGPTHPPPAYPPPYATPPITPTPAPLPVGQRHLASGLALLVAGVVGLVVAVWLLVG